MLRTRRIALVLSGLLIGFGGVSANARAASAQEKFFEAYYLEHNEGDLEAAARLYAEVVKDRRADAKMKSQAEARLAVCKEELACSDFAALMPPNALLYAEIKRPGEQVMKLLDQLGLLAKGDAPAIETGKRLAISPALIKELFGIGGAAVAVTGFDPMSQKPMGVVVFHPGSVDVIRGLIETGLPIGGKSVDPIGGFATYSIEGKAYVTLTSRLVVVSPQRSQIVGVIQRLQGKQKLSLATNPALADALKDRDDSLIFFCVNAKPIMPMVNSMLASGGAKNRKMAIAQAVLDLNSLHSVVGRAGVNDDGLFLEFALRLDEGHHNLVYNLFRTPAINSETLNCIPAGAAAFVVGALNEAPSRYGTVSPESEAVPVVTLLDFGREIFANITSWGIFVLPPDGAPEAGPPIPDIGIALTVNDPSKTRALWTQILGIASLASGATGIEGAALDIDGVEARKYQFEGGPTIYFATIGHDALITTSQSAMSRSITAKRSKKSILTDKTFAKDLSRIGQKTTKAMFVHLGRCAEIGKRYMGPGELAEAEPFMDALTETVASCVVEHSGELFRISAQITGIPKVGDLVAQILTEQQHKHEARARLTQAKRSGQWDKAIELVDAQLGGNPGDIKLLQTKFDILANGKNDSEAALACGKQFFEQAQDDATALNNFAWALLTNDEYQGRFGQLALEFTRRSNKITGHKNWMFVDTLALAEFEAGDVATAVELQNKVIKLADGASESELKGRLARFEDALNETKLAGEINSPAP